MRREDQVQAMFKKMIQEFGTIDILVNNAGLQKDAPIDQMSLAKRPTQVRLDESMVENFRKQIMIAQTPNPAA